MLVRLVQLKNTLLSALGQQESNIKSPESPEISVLPWLPEKNSFLNLRSWYLKTKGHQGVLERELCRRVWQWETCRTNSSDIQVISYGSWELELRYCKANKTWSNMTERKHPALPITKLIPCTDHCSVLSYGGTVADILVYNLYLFLPALSKKWEILWPSYISHWFKTWSLLVLWVPWK